MRKRYNRHRPVFLIDIVDGQPHRYHLAWRQRPVTGVLVPAHLLVFAGLLAEIVRHGAHQIRAEQIFDDINKRRLAHELPIGLMQVSGGGESAESRLFGRVIGFEVEEAIRCR